MHLKANLSDANVIKKINVWNFAQKEQKKH